MLFNIPQFIDVEDKVAGPLTAKQIFWLVGMGAVLFLVWTIFDITAFLALTVPIIIIFSIFAFYRPYNQSFLTFVINSVMFLFRPKLFVWDRPGMIRETKVNVSSQENLTKNNQKRLTIEEIHAIAQVVDRKGKYR